MRILKNTTLLFGLIAIVSTSCKRSQTADSKQVEEQKIEPLQVLDSVMSARLQSLDSSYDKDAFMSLGLVSFDFTMVKDGNNISELSFTMLTDMSKIRMEYKDGSSVLFTDNTIYASPDVKDERRARFDILTWSYFFVLPYKLRDPGTKLEALPNRTYQDLDYQPFKLSFNKVGDTPDDWYILYPNPKSGLLDFVTYIVTFSKTVEEAEKNLGSIRYSNYMLKNGAHIPQIWGFHKWSDETGLGQQKVIAKITNIKFPQANPKTFVVSDNSVKILAL